MSDLQADLIKIGIGAILGSVLTYFVNRRLESHRARNVYFQKLAEEKLAALKEVGLIHAQQLVLLTRVASVLEQTAPQTSEDKGEFASDFAAAFKAFRLYYIDHSAISSSHAALFGSRGLVDQMIAYQKQMLSFFDTLEDLKARHAPDALVERVRSLTQAFTTLQHAIAREIRVPPTE